MLGTKDITANIAVKDLKRGRKFYEDTLGLKVTDTDGEEVVTFRSGSSSLYVYRSQYAGSNQATAATWTVGNDLDEIVRTLASKGVKFEHYDMPGGTRQGDVHVFGPMKVAWFKDPDGNILCLANG